MTYVWRPIALWLLLVGCVLLYFAILFGAAALFEAGHWILAILLLAVSMASYFMTWFL